MNKGFTIIVATTPDRGIGVNGALPWCNSIDMKYFRNITTQRINEDQQNAVIMGRNTFASMNYKTLPNRKNFCITTNEVLCDNVDRDDIWFFDSFDKAINTLTGCDEKYIYKLSDVTKDKLESIFVIGGEMLYNEAIKHPKCKEILINEIQTDVQCDTFFPEIDTTIFKLVDEKYLSNDVINRRYIRSEDAPTNKWTGAGESGACGRNGRFA